MKTKVGYSQNVNAFDAGVETAKSANLKDMSAGILFTSVVYDQIEIINGIKSVAGDIPFLGCTSSAAICTHDGYLNSADGYAGMMSFGGNAEVVVAGSEKTNESPREIGVKIATEVMNSVKGKDKEPDYFFMTANPGEEEEYLKGIQDVLGDIPVFGGSAADNTVEGKWSVICNDKVFTNGCAIAVFYTETKMKNIYAGAYTETEHVGIITKLEGKRTLVEINGEPAVKKYAEWTGKDLDKLKEGGILVETICEPLGVKDPIGNIVAVRHPMYANPDYSMNIGADLAVNTAVILLKNTPEGILKANEKTVKELNALMNDNAKSYFLIHCGGRRLGLSIAEIEDRIYPEIKKATGDKEFLMAFTFGEYGSNEHSSNTVGGLSLSYTGFEE